VKRAGDGDLVGHRLTLAAGVSQFEKNPILTWLASSRRHPNQRGRMFVDLATGECEEEKPKAPTPA
jgi:hypothetical protein